jgi:flavin-dependent dehydrogenase
VATNGKAKSQAEVVIIGAGPAGLACAIACARQGLQVELIDAMKPPIDKACGEGLMPDSFEALAAIGFSLDRDFDGIETHLLRGIRFIGDPTSSTHYTTTEAAFHGGPGRGVRRTLLHQLLFDRAVVLGVRFHWENSVQGIIPGAVSTLVRTNRQTFHARYLIGADGPQSRVAVWAKLAKASVHSRRIGLRQHYTVAPWTDFVEVYWSDSGQAYVTRSRPPRSASLSSTKIRFQVPPKPSPTFSRYSAILLEPAPVISHGAPSLWAAD